MIIHIPPPYFLPPHSPSLIDMCANRQAPPLPPLPRPPLLLLPVPYAGAASSSKIPTEICNFWSFYVYMCRFMSTNACQTSSFVVYMTAVCDER